MESTVEMIVGIWKLLVFLFLIIVTPKEELCGLDIASELISPDGQYKAYIYQFDCGATTPFTSNVTVLENNAKLEYKSGNLFSAYGGSKTGSWHGPYTEVEWVADNKLSISYIADAVVTKKKKSVGEVSAKYVPIETANKLLKYIQPTKAGFMGRAIARPLAKRYTKL